MPRYTDELRDLFNESLECCVDKTVFVPIEEITEVVGEFIESSYEELAELDDEFIIEEKSSWPSCLGNTIGFYVSQHP
ncbi:MAG: hypothetical protein ACXABD_04525 [Candidatus Thorarchaeota archaeon]|jgi:hypothetical protein